MRVFRAQHLELTASSPFPVYADGEHLADLPASLRVLPRALSVIVPPRAELERAGPQRGAVRRQAGRRAGRSEPPAGRAAAAAARPCPAGSCCAWSPTRSPASAPASSAGVTIVSATNGKTTTAGMIAAVLAAEGREPVHNRAGSNMTWGVATALLEQRGSEGLFEVDEAWLPKVAAALDPSLIVLGNLFRDQLDRYGEIEVLADEWATLVAGAQRAHPLRPQRRRPADRGPRPRHRGAAPRGRRLLRHRRPRAGAARAPARLRRQALPPLRPSLRLRARLRRPPRPLLVPELRRLPPRARPRRDRDRAARHGGLAVHRAPPRRRAAARAAAAGPLQRLQRAGGDRRGDRARGRGREGRAPRSPASAPPSAGWRRSSRAASRSRSCWSRTRRAPTRSCARCASRPASGSSTSGSPSTTGSPTAATSPGSGTPTSSCSPRRVGG